MILHGNIVQRDRCGFGKLHISGTQITKIEYSDSCRSDENWILPGFIDVHLHGIYDGDATADKVELMVKSAPRSGLTTFCPALASDTPENMLAFVKKVRDLMQHPIPGGTQIAGSHLEGPYIEYVHRGGMNPEHIRPIDLDEIQKFLDAAAGTMKIMTLSPELENAGAAIRLLTANKVLVSAGHTGLQPEKVDEFVQDGGRAICHLFDTFDPREVRFGVSQVSLADQVLVDDNLYIELIPDGVHVLPVLRKLAIRAAGVNRVICITDSMSGTGFPDGEYPMTDWGRTFTLKNGDCCRLTEKPDLIVGSCLTLNQAFFNLVEKDKFSVIDAARLTATNAAEYLDIADSTGSLEVGLAADIAVLASDKLTVRQTFIAGECVFNGN